MMTKKSLMICMRDGDRVLGIVVVSVHEHGVLERSEC